MEARFDVILGNAIREIRRSKNLSQEYMAYNLRISQNAYSKIEAGKSQCSVYRFITILNLLDTSPLEFFLKKELFYQAH